MSRRNRNRPVPSEPQSAEPADDTIEVSDPTIHAIAVYPDGIGYREVRLKLPIEVVEEYAIESRDPEYIGVVGMRAFEWVSELPQTVAEEGQG